MTTESEIDKLRRENRELREFGDQVLHTLEVALKKLAEISGNPVIPPLPEPPYRKRKKPAG